MSGLKQNDTAVIAPPLGRKRPRQSPKAEGDSAKGKQNVDTGDWLFFPLKDKKDDEDVSNGKTETLGTSLEIVDSLLTEQVLLTS